MTKKDTAGKYVGKYPFGTEVLILNEDGTYVHYFESKTKKHENKGTWRLEFQGLDQRFILSDWEKHFDTYTLEMYDPPEKTSVNTQCDGDMIIMNPDNYEYNLYREK